METKNTSQMTDSQYVKKGGGICPACGSDEIKGGSINVDGVSAFQEVICLECNASWDDVYALTGYCDLTEDRKANEAVVTPQEIDSEPEMQEFEATVTRIGYGSRTFRLSARSAEDARDIADDDAGNHLYSEHAADYTVEVRKIQ